MDSSPTILLDITQDPDPLLSPNIYTDINDIRKLLDTFLIVSIGLEIRQDDLYIIYARWCVVKGIEITPMEDLTKLVTKYFPEAQFYFPKYHSTPMIGNLTWQYNVNVGEELVSITKADREKINFSKGKEPDDEETDNEEPENLEEAEITIHSFRKKGLINKEQNIKKIWQHENKHFLLQMNTAEIIDLLLNHSDDPDENLRLIDCILKQLLSTKNMEPFMAILFALGEKWKHNSEIKRLIEKYWMSYLLIEHPCPFL